MTDTKNAYMVRDGLLKLLSDDEIARVSRIEGDARLDYGDEYLDLGNPSAGVLKADGKTAPVSMGRVLPRKVVSEMTWTKLLLEIAEPGTHQSHFSD